MSAPLRVALDARPITSSRGGVATYCRGLVDGWADEYAAEGLLYDKRPQPADLVLPPTLRWRASPGPLWIFRQAPRMARQDHIDIFHGANHIVPPLLSVPSVVTIHDVSLLTRVTHHTARNIALTLPQMALSLRRATLFMADSHATAKELAGVPFVEASRIRVVHLAAASRFSEPANLEVERVRALYALPQTFFLFVGSLGPNKNVVRLVQALAALKNDDSPPSLIIAGRGGQDVELVQSTVDKLNVGHLVKFISYVEPSDLPALYAAAAAFVYPSLFEGFGLPALEAMACGTPVVTSNVSSLPEVVGDAALTVDPRSVGDLAAAMRRVLQDDSLRQHLRVEGLQRATLFSWNKTVRETVAVYREAVELNRGRGRRNR